MNKITKKEPVTIEEALKMFLKSYKLTKGLNTQRVNAAWDQASGAAKYTIRRYYRDGILFITLNSSVVRSQLGFQKAALIEKMNAILSDDILFSKDEPAVGYIKDLRLK